MTKSYIAEQFSFMEGIDHSTRLKLQDSTKRTAEEELSAFKVDISQKCDQKLAEPDHLSTLNTLSETE